MSDIQDKIQSILTGCAKMQNLTPSQLKHLSPIGARELDCQLSIADEAVWEAVEIVEELQ